MIKGLIFLLFALLITSCVSPTSYKSESRSYGYSESKISTNRYEVVFKANNDTKPERINDYVLLRAAELTLKNGYTYFSVVTTHYTNEIKKIAARGHYNTPTIYIKNTSDYCEPINLDLDLDGPNKSNLLTVNHIKSNSIRHNNFDSRLPDLDDVNSIGPRGIENIEFYSTVKKTIIALSNNESNTKLVDTKKSASYRAEDVLKKITRKYQIQL